MELVRGGQEPWVTKVPWGFSLASFGMSDGLSPCCFRVDLGAGALVQGAPLALRVARMLDEGSGTTELESKFLVKINVQCFGSNRASGEIAIRLFLVRLSVV